MVGAVVVGEVLVVDAGGAVGVVSAGEAAAATAGWVAGTREAERPSATLAPARATAAQAVDTLRAVPRRGRAPATPPRYTTMRATETVTRLP